MKNILLLGLFLLSDIISFAQAPSADEFADSLSTIYTRLASGKFQNVYPLTENQGDTVFSYKTSPILNADNVDLWGGEDGLNYSLKYLRTNDIAKKTAKSVIKAFRKIADDPVFQLKTDNEYAASLFTNGREVMSYWIPSPQALETVQYDEYIFIHIMAPAPLKPVLADEASYHNKFPSTPTSSLAPQAIVKFEADGKRYQIWNGLFKYGLMKKGYIRYIGYDEFLNGKWYSDQWYWGETTASTEVIFQPKGSTDSIYGHLHTTNFYSFYPDSRYNDARHASSFAVNAPKWLTAVYEKKLMADYYKSTSVSSEEFDRQMEHQARDREEQERVRCQYCGGTGNIHSGEFLWGKEYMKTCPYCHGTGKIE